MAFQDPDGVSVIKKGDYFTFALVFIVAFSYFLSWRHEGLGGLIMVLVGLGISAIANWRFGIPFFVVGQLFVLYWYLLKSAKTKTSTKQKIQNPKHAKSSKHKIRSKHKV
jgi:hypothetical protein